MKVSPCIEHNVTYFAETCLWSVLTVPSLCLQSGPDTSLSRSNFSFVKLYSLNHWKYMPNAKIIKFMTNQRFQIVFVLFFLTLQIPVIFYSVGDITELSFKWRISTDIPILMYVPWFFKQCNRNLNPDYSFYLFGGDYILHIRNVGLAHCLADRFLIGVLLDHTPCSIPHLLFCIQEETGGGKTFGWLDSRHGISGWIWSIPACGT